MPQGRCSVGPVPGRGISLYSAVATEPCSGKAATPTPASLCARSAKFTLSAMRSSPAGPAALALPSAALAVASRPGTFAAADAEGGEGALGGAWCGLRDRDREDDEDP